MRLLLVLTLLAAACGPSSPSETTDDATTADTTTITTTSPATTDPTSEPPTTSSGPADGCGDGERGDGEECDDGNGVDDDGCRADCTWPRRDMWYLHVDDGGLFNATGCIHPRQLAVTPDLFAVFVGCVRDGQGRRARMAVATPEGELAANVNWDGSALWAVATPDGAVFVGDWNITPQRRAVTGELLGELPIPPNEDASVPLVTNLLAWPQHGLALMVTDDLSQPNQRILLYEGDSPVQEFAVEHWQDFIALPDVRAVVEPSGALWGVNGEHDGFYRVGLAGVIDATVGEQDNPTSLQLVPGGGFVGAAASPPIDNPCSRFLAARVWRWDGTGQKLWTARDCDENGDAALGRMELGRIAVDHQGAVIVTGTAFLADGVSPSGPVVLKLDGETGARIWGTSVDPGPGYTGTTVDAVQIGADDSIFLAGREFTPDNVQDGWIRRLAP